MRVTRILVPTDLSDDSLSALSVADDLASATSAKIVLLHVSSNLPTTAATFAPTPEQFDEAVKARQQELRAQSREWLLQHAPAPAGQPPRLLKVRFGDPVRQIIRYARQHEVDIIVVATHGRSGLARRLLGSVAQALLRSAPCQVVVVRRAPGQ